jgi:preprotein translocase SecE subunit
MADKNSGKTVVKRIKASGAGSSAARTEEAQIVKKKVATDAPSKKTVQKIAKKVDKPAKKSFFLFRPIFAVGRYFRDSWRELRQVRWTNRRATWGLTLAVILFCIFFAALIMLCDWIVSWVTQEVIL